MQDAGCGMWDEGCGMQAGWPGMLWIREIVSWAAMWGVI